MNDLAPTNTNEQNPDRQDVPAAFMPFYAAGWCCRQVADAMEEAKEGSKTSPEGKRRKKHWIKRNVASRLVGAIWVSGKTTVRALAKNPGIRASMGSMGYLVKEGTAEVQDGTSEASKNTDAILRLFQANQLCPKRIAIDGVPGSGKSTLARALAAKCDFKVKTLDYIDMDKPLDFQKEQIIYEHHRLLRTQNVEVFDVIIYLDEPVEISKEKCVHRKRGAINIDVFDYGKLKRIGKKAFFSANGTVYSLVGTPIRVKIRSKDGFRAFGNIRDEVKEKGFRIKGRSKEELLFLSVYGKAEKGIKAYLNHGAYSDEFKKGFSAGIRKFFKT